MIKILIRFGDLMLKGRNIRVFVNKLNESIKFKLKDLDVKLKNYMIVQLFMWMNQLRTKLLND